MSIGLIGRKCGMTRLFTPEGNSIAVTVIEVPPNRIAQLKTRDNDGYNAIQVTAGTKRPSLINKAIAGHFAKAQVEAGWGLWEFNLDDASSSDAATSYKVGDAITVEIFKEGQVIDVTGVSKGKGFAGVIKRHHFAGQDATHGNSLSHRVHGSTGQRQSPGRVFKGKRMAGHLGNKKRTVENQKIVRVDAKRNLILVSGSVPGAKSGVVIIRSAIKHIDRSQAEGN